MYGFFCFFYNDKFMESYELNDELKLKYPYRILGWIPYNLISYLMAGLAIVLYDYKRIVALFPISKFCKYATVSTTPISFVVEKCFTSPM